MHICVLMLLLAEEGNNIRYNKRHMAQEDHLKDTKSKEELENTKSTIR